MEGETKSHAFKKPADRPSEVRRCDGSVFDAVLEIEINSSDFKIGEVYNIYMGRGGVLITRASWAETCTARVTFCEFPFHTSKKCVPS